MSPFDLMFWVLAIVVTVCGLALAVVIIAGVVRGIKPKPKPRDTTIWRGDDRG
uniref:Uncharacterized protein n=1 Tax=Micrococcus phage Olihed TaxID=3092209 RepID=A0AAU6R626_9CAUD